MSQDGDQPRRPSVATCAVAAAAALAAASCANIIGVDGDYYEVASSGTGGSAAGGAAGGAAGQGGSGGGGMGGGNGIADSCRSLHQSQPALGSGVYTIDPDGDGGTTAFEVVCDMETDGGGWTLVYNRVNAYFTPDHMHHQLPASAGPTLSDNSTSWFIIPNAHRWRWQVSVDAGSTFRQLVTSIPAEAANTAHVTVTDVAIADIHDNTTGASGPFYYQTMVEADVCAFGCASGAGTWWGMVNVTQGAGDQTNPGIGGHSDMCDLDATAQPVDNYTFGDDRLELYWTDHKNIQGNGIGGTNCIPSGPTDLYRMRIWVR